MQVLEQTDYYSHETKSTGYYLLELVTRCETLGMLILHREASRGCHPPVTSSSK